MEELKGVRVGFAMCGSFCTFSDCFASLERLLSLGCTVVPVMSFNAYETDTRFGNAAEHRERLAAMCGDTHDSRRGADRPHGYDGRDARCELHG